MFFYEDSQKAFIHFVLAVLSIYIFNCFETITQITLAINVFNLLMIACFDVPGFILCIILKFIL